MKTAREYAHDLVNWDGMNHCGPRTHSPTCDKGTEMFQAVLSQLGEVGALLQTLQWQGQAPNDGRFVPEGCSPQGCLNCLATMGKHTERCQLAALLAKLKPYIDEHNARERLENGDVG